MRCVTSEVDLFDNAELPVGDHESEDDDDTNKDEKSQKYSSKVANDPEFSTTNFLCCLLTCVTHLVLL